MFKNLFKIKLKLIALIALVIILIQLITAYFFGFIAKEQLEKQYNTITKSPFVKVIKHTYNRGFFTSISETELVIDGSNLNRFISLLYNNSEHINESEVVNSKIQFKYILAANHGFFSGIMKGYLVPTVAYCKIKLLYSPSLNKLLNKFFNNRTPLLIDDIIYLNKSGKFIISSPSFTYEEAVSGVKVNWNGLNITNNYNSKFNEFNTIISIPLFQLSAPSKGNLELKNFSYNSYTKTSKNQIKVGNTKLLLDTFSIKWLDSINVDFKLGDVINIFTGISSVDFLNNIDTINPSGFSLNKISYISASNDDDHYFSASSKAYFESLVSESKTYGPMEMTMAIDHVLSPQFSIFMDKINYATIGSNSSKEELKSVLESIAKENLGLVLASKPKITLKNFTLRLPSGIMQMSGYATTNNFESNDINNQDSFLKKLELEFNFSVPKEVLSYLFLLQLKYLLSAGKANIDEQSTIAMHKVVDILLENQLRSLIRKGYVKKNNRNIESKLFFKDGKLFINNIESKQ